MRSLLLLPLLLTGCDLLAVKSFVPCEDTGATDDGAACPAYWPDGDGDGWGDGTAVSQEFCEDPGEGWADRGNDCDDADPDVNPGATEVCNEIDDDCDTLVDGKDEGLDLSTATTWYPDLDDDGFGTEAGAVVDCEAPADFVAQAGDCDDGRDDVSPAAAEVCDGVDNDCDTLTDDEDDLDDPYAPEWWPDSDGDGWATEGATVQACEQPPGYAGSEYLGDCDDDEPLAAPDLDEVCDDGIDNDCDSLVDEDCTAAVTGAYSSDDLDLVFAGSDSGDGAGYSFGGRGDLDGDSQPDLVIGAYRADTTPGDDAGAVYVLPGPWSPADGVVDLDSRAAATWSGVESDGNAGVAVAIVGDVDNDGYDDVLVGADRVLGTASDAYDGRAYLLHGPALAGGSLDTADSVIYGPLENAYLGRYLSPAGDLDDDGFDDVIIGAYGGTGVSTGLTQPGVLYVYRGPLESIETAGTADWEITGIEDGGQLAHSTVGQDLTGDGIDDLVFGASGASRAYLMAGPLPASFGVEDAIQLVGEASDDEAGFALAGPGDVDGDGQDDLLVGAHGSDRGGADAGAAFLLLGPITVDTPLETAEVVVVGDAAADYAGLAVAAAGDLDGDDVADIAVAAPWADLGDTNAGAVGIFYGSSDLSGVYPMEVADLRFDGSAASQFLGDAVHGVGDLDGDGLDDLGMGSWNVAGGEVSIFFGGRAVGTSGDTEPEL